MCSSFMKKFSKSYITYLILMIIEVFIYVCMVLLLLTDVNRWESLTVSGLEARGCHTLCAVSDRLLLFGGSSDFNSSLQQCNKFHGDILTATLPGQL